MSEILKGEIIVGAKAKSPNSSGAVEAPDTLGSKSTAKVIDLLSEGEVEGLQNGMAGIYLDRVPVQNNDGSLNFTGIRYEFRPGTQDQNYIPDFESSNVVYAQNVEVTIPIAYEYQVVDANTDVAVVTMSTPQLTDVDTETGDVNGTEIDFVIEVKEGGSDTWVKAPSNFFKKNSFSTKDAPGGVSSEDTSIIRIVVSTKVPASDFTLPTKNVDISISYTTVIEGITNNLATITHTHEAGNYSGGELDQDHSVITTEHYITNLDRKSYFVTVNADTPSYLNDWAAAESVVEDQFKIKGKTTKTYERSYPIRLPRTPGGGGYPWTIRVTRITPDSDRGSLQNKLFVASVTEKIEAKITYANSAVMGLQFNSNEFSSIPDRAYHMKLLKIKVPSNYDPITRSYDGPWDGTFKVAWSNNPAWCFYDLATNDRYGLGQYVTNINKWQLYSIGQYCDELVDNGYGGKEPRFTLNAYIQTQKDAITLLRELSSSFRGMMYWAANELSVNQDSPKSPKYIYTNSNVVEGDFSYSGSAKKARHTVAIVWWNDPARFYELVPEYVEDTISLNKYGYRETSINAFGCTSRGQARRLGKYILLTERYETETVVFKAGPDTAYLEPGDIITIVDNERPHSATAKHYGGRLVATGTNSLTLDREVVIEAGKVYKFVCMSPSLTIQEKEVALSPGTYTTISLVQSLPEAPLVKSVWLLYEQTEVVTDYRVVNIAKNEGAIREITAVEYVHEKFDQTEDLLPFEPIVDAKVLPGAATPPTSVTVEEELYQSGPSQVSNRMIISWVRVPGANSVSYEVSYRKGSNSWTNLPTTTSNSVVIDNANPGSYEVSVTSIGIGGVRSEPIVVSANLLGKTALPSDVLGFTTSKTGSLVNMTWQVNPELDISSYEIRRGVDDSEWGLDSAGSDSINFVGRVSHPTTRFQFEEPNLSNNSYLIKAIDTSGNYSDTALGDTFNSTLAPPTSLVADNSEQDRRNPDGSYNPVIKWSWTLSTTAAESLAYQEFQYRLTSPFNTSWRSSQLPVTETTTLAKPNDPDLNEFDKTGVMEARVRVVDHHNNASDWVTANNGGHDMSVSPDSPVSVTATGASGGEPAQTGLIRLTVVRGSASSRSFLVLRSFQQETPLVDATDLDFFYYPIASSSSTQEIEFLTEDSEPQYFWVAELEADGTLGQSFPNNTAVGIEGLAISAQGISFKGSFSNRAAFEEVFGSPPPIGFGYYDEDLNASYVYTSTGYQVVAQDGADGNEGQAAEIYYIKPLDGRAIRNSQGSLRLEARKVTGIADEILSTGDIQLREVGTGTVYGTGYEATFVASDIGVSLIVELADGLGNVYDTIDLQDLSDASSYAQIVNPASLNTTVTNEANSAIIFSFDRVANRITARFSGKNASPNNVSYEFEDVTGQIGWTLTEVSLESGEEFTVDSNLDFKSPPPDNRVSYSKVYVHNLYIDQFGVDTYYLENTDGISELQLYRFKLLKADLPVCVRVGDTLLNGNVFPVNGEYFFAFDPNIQLVVDADPLTFSGNRQRGYTPPGPGTVSCTAYQNGSEIGSIVVRTNLNTLTGEISDGGIISSSGETINYTFSSPTGEPAQRVLFTHANSGRTASETIAAVSSGAPGVPSTQFRIRPLLFDPNGTHAEGPDKANIADNSFCLFDSLGVNVPSDPGVTPVEWPDIRYIGFSGSTEFDTKTGKSLFKYYNTENIVPGDFFVSYIDEDNFGVFAIVAISNPPQSQDAGKDFVIEVEYRTSAGYLFVSDFTANDRYMGFERPYISKVIETYWEPPSLSVVTDSTGNYGFPVSAQLKIFQDGVDISGNVDFQSSGLTNITDFVFNDNIGVDDNAAYPIGFLQVNSVTDPARRSEVSTTFVTATGERVYSAKLPITTIVDPNLSGGGPQPLSVEVIGKSEATDDVNQPYDVSVTASYSGGVDPVTYSWSFTGDGSIVGSATSPTCTVRLTGKPANQSSSGTVTCTITDNDSTVASDSAIISVLFIDFNNNF